MIIFEKTELLCNKEPDDVIFIDKVEQVHKNARNQILIPAVILIFLAILSITIIIICWILRKKSYELKSFDLNKRLTNSKHINSAPWISWWDIISKIFIFIKLRF